MTEKRSMETVIRNYFRAWLTKDVATVQNTFSENATYSECFGPEYHGRPQIVRWFEEWNRTGRVLDWTIKRIITQERTLVAQWHFKCDYGGEAEFDGVTIADFDADGRITRLCEFQSKAEHYFPYEK